MRTHPLRLSGVLCPHSGPRAKPLCPAQQSGTQEAPRPSSLMWGNWVPNLSHRLRNRTPRLRGPGAEPPSPPAAAKGPRVPSPLLPYRPSFLSQIPSAWVCRGPSPSAPSHRLWPGPPLLAPLMNCAQGSLSHSGEGEGTQRFLGCLRLRCCPHHHRGVDSPLPPSRAAESCSPTPHPPPRSAPSSCSTPHTHTASLSPPQSCR